MAQLANLLSIARGLASIPFAVLMSQGGSDAAFWALLLVGSAMATDLVDGRIARWTGSASGFGRSLDHGADVCFVSSGLVAASLRGAVPTLLPVVVVLAFAQYVVDSYWLLRSGQLRMNRLGRINGVLYFAPLVGDTLARLELLRGPIGEGLGLLTYAIGWLLVGSTLTSMVDRYSSLERS